MPKRIAIYSPELYVPTIPYTTNRVLLAATRSPGYYETVNSCHPWEMCKLFIYVVGYMYKVAMMVRGSLLLALAMQLYILAAETNLTIRQFTQDINEI